MNCPKCGSYSVRVIDTMPSLDGKIYRRRKCMDCSSCFRTVECMDDGSEEFNKQYIIAAENKSPYLKNLYSKCNEKKEKAK